MQRTLNQKINFFISIAMIAVFGFLMTVTVVQALNRNAPLVQKISSPISVSVEDFN